MRATAEYRQKLCTARIAPTARVRTNDVAGIRKGTRSAKRAAARAIAVPAARNATAVATLVPWSKATRAAMWLLPKVTAIASRIAIPAQRGTGFKARTRRDA